MKKLFIALFLLAINAKAFAVVATGALAAASAAAMASKNGSSPSILEWLGRENLEYALAAGVVLAIAGGLGGLGWYVKYAMTRPRAKARR